MFKKTLVIAALSAAVVSGSAYSAAARDYISIVGSSTVYPFATVVAEQFGRTTKFKTPKVESTGSGGGLKLFCAGVGVEHPDITNASRRIKKSEQELCAKNGIADIIEVKVGYDGIVLGQSNKSAVVGMSRKDIFLALAKMVPGEDGKRCTAEDKKNGTCPNAIEGLEQATFFRIGLGDDKTAGHQD